MTLPLPEQPPPDTGQRPDSPLSDDILAAATRDALHQLRYDNPDLPSYKDGPRIGDTPPVAQPGRPPMSARAADASGMMLAASVLTLSVGGSASLVLWVSGYADPVVVGIIGGAPAALALALSRLAKSARGVLPDEHHHHNYGPVKQDHSTVTNTNWLWGRFTTRHEKGD